MFKVRTKESKFTLQRRGAAAGRQTAHDAMGPSTCQAEVEDLRGKYGPDSHCKMFALVVLDEKSCEDDWSIAHLG